jgi:hypothetical protein
VSFLSLDIVGGKIIQLAMIFVYILVILLINKTVIVLLAFWFLSYFFSR